MSGENLFDVFYGRREVVSEVGEARSQSQTASVSATPPISAPTAEQQARDVLERLGVPLAHLYSSGELVELANILAEHARYRNALLKVARCEGRWSNHPLTRAQLVIEDMADVAIKALGAAFPPAEEPS